MFTCGKSVGFESGENVKNSSYLIRVGKLLGDTSLLPSQIFDSSRVPIVFEEQFLTFPRLVAVGLREMWESPDVEERDLGHRKTALGLEFYERRVVDGIPMTGVFAVLEAAAPPTIPMVDGEYVGVTIIDTSSGRDTEKYLFTRGPLSYPSSYPDCFLSITANIKMIRSHLIGEEAALANLRT